MQDIHYELEKQIDKIGRTTNYKAEELTENQLQELTLLITMQEKIQEEIIKITLN